MPATTPEDAHRLFVNAFNAGDVEALVALYEPDAVLCNAAGEIKAGLSAIRQACQAFLASKPKPFVSETWRCSAACGRLRAPTPVAGRSEPTEHSQR